MKAEYVSITKFAKLAGVSRQTIYNRIDKDLSIYCKVDNGVKVLNKEGLKLFNVKSVKQDLTPFDILSKELEYKNKEIEELREQNKMLSEQLLSLSDKVGDSLQTISKTQLATKMIEGKKVIDEQPKKSKWKFWDKKRED